MRGKLSYECPVCGRKAKISNSTTRIRCSCGTVQYDDKNGDEFLIQGTRVDIPKWLRDSRRKECEACENHNKERCKLIDLGCRKTFIENLNNPKGECPEGRWCDPEDVGEVLVNQEAACQFARRSQGSVQCERCRRVVLTDAEPSTVFAVCRYQAAGQELLDRSLIYHVCALESNDHWRENIDSIVRRWHLFTNQKIIAVAIGDGMYGIEDVRMHFPEDAEFIPVANDKQLREVKSFPVLLSELKSRIKMDRKSITFYAHTKGNSTADGEEGAELWRRAMYHYLLDHSHACFDLLQTHPCVGTTKIVWHRDAVPPYPSRLQVGNWMFAGTFYWFRNDLVFSNPDWNYIPKDRYAAEAWLSGMFEHNEAASVFQPWPAYQYPTPNPYDPNNYLPFVRAFE